MTEMIDKKMQRVHNNAECLKSKIDINQALDKMASEITAKLQHENPLLLCVMVGGLIPAGHLATRLDFPLQMDYLHVSRYGKSTRGGDLHWFVEPRADLKGRTVLIVEDILDGGLTLTAIIDYCQKQHAKAVYTAVVVDKIREREPDALKKADFTGMEVPDKFLYGFGLDYDEYMRNHFGIYAVSDADLHG